ncbi:zinc protease [Spirochaetia bacterium]|nr:zinc protease [Spirochaetia bacterium]
MKKSFGKTLRFFLPFFLCIVFLGACSTAGDTGVSTGVPLENDPALVSGVLENGLSYRILTNSYPENRIFLRLAVKAGSILEDNDQRGIAHLVEHMAFNGSAHFAGNELDSYFESLGMAFGPDINAYTSFDETVYMLEIPADNSEALRVSFTVIADWAGALSFDKMELERERGVVLEEWRLGRGVEGRAWDALLPFLFPSSRYANRDTIGKPDIIRSVSRQRVVDFYKKWYRPELMTVVIVGDADSALLEKELRAQLSAIPAGEKKINRPEYPISVPKTKKELFLSDPETPYTQVFTGSLFPSILKKTVDDYRLFTVMETAQSVFNARLREKTDEGTLLIDAESFSTEILRSMNAGITWFRPRKGSFYDAFRSMMDEADRFSQFGITEAELEREKKRMRGDALDLWQNREKRDSGLLADNLVEHILAGTPLLSPDDEYELALDTINTLTVEEVNTAVKQIFTDRGSRLVVSSSPRAGLPSKGKIKQLWKSYRNNSLSPYEENLDDRPLYPSELAGQPGALVKERVLMAGGPENPPVVEFTFSNGARVVVCYTDFQKGLFMFNAVSRGGLSLADDDEYLHAAVSEDYAGMSGLNGFRNSDITKKLAGKRVSVKPVLEEFSAGLRGTAASGDIEDFFQLVNMYFAAPNFTSAAWERVKTDIEENIESNKNYPRWAFYEEMRKVIYGKSPRFVYPDAEFLEKLNREKAEQWYRELFHNAGDFTFIFTGDIDPDEVKRLAGIYLASLPAAEEKKEARDIYPPFPPGKPLLRFKKGIEKQGAVRIHFGGINPEIEGDTFAEKDLIAAMTNFVEIRLRNSIREKMGATYGIGVYCTQENYPLRRWDAQIVFGCEPDRAEQLAGQVVQELAEMLVSPITADELAALREIFIRSRETAAKTNEFWLAQLKENYRRGEESAHYSDAEFVRQLINDDTLRRLIGRYFSPSNYVTGILLPE